MRADYGLLVLTGPPGTGKTTLARHLGDQLKLPVLGKDMFKERAGECMDVYSLEDSKRAGSVAYAVLYEAVEAMLKAQVGAVVESNFARENVVRLHALARRYGAKFACVLVSCDEAVRRDRIVRRPRHRVHFDDSRPAADSYEYGGDFVDFVVDTT